MSTMRKKCDVMLMKQRIHIKQYEIKMTVNLFGN